MTRVLVAGLPRSGTTWVGQALSKADHAAYVHEPDNELGHPFALRAKGSLGRFPFLEPDESAGSYERLWRAAFDSSAEGGVGGGVRRLRTRASDAIRRRTPRPELQAALSSPDARRPLRVAAAAALAVPEHPRRAGNVVVKSVHAPLALEWIARRFHPAVVVVLRSPLNAVASLLELKLPDRDRGLDASPKIRERLLDRLGIRAPDPHASDVARTAWQVGLLSTALEDAASRNPSFLVVTHEDLCVDTGAKFRSVCERLGLPWSVALSDFLAQSNRPGTGFSTNRVREDEPERWRQRLTAEEVDEVLRTIRGFPLNLNRWSLQGL